VVASLGFWGGNQFYDSLLTDVSEQHEYDLVSGYGYALGYLGGGLLFALNVAMVLKPAMFGLADAGEAVRWSFVSVGIWWAGFTLFTGAAGARAIDPGSVTRGRSDSRRRG